MYTNIIIRVKLLEVTLQFGLWADADDVNIVSRLLQGRTFCDRMHTDPDTLEAVYFGSVASWQIESWLPDCGVIH